MAEITMDRDAFEKLQSGDHEALRGDSKLASFLVNRFQESEAQIFNIWTYVF